MLAAVTLVVALACLHCVPALWREPRRVDWVRLSIGSVAMACLHLAMIVTMSGPTGGGHGQHAAAGLAGAAAVSGAARCSDCCCRSSVSAWPGGHWAA